jgi:hypothetical protein
MEEKFTISQGLLADTLPGHVFAGSGGDRSGLPWI